MNKDLALKISKHPLIKRLLESTDQKTVARLIVEELMNEDISTFNQYQQQIESAKNIEELEAIVGTLKLTPVGDKETELTKDELGQLEIIIKDVKNKLNGQKSPGEDDKEQPASTSAELKPTLDRLANFLKRAGVLAESLERFFISLNPKDPKKLSDSFNKNFSKEQIELLKTHFADKKNTIVFINQYFGNNPDKDSILSSLEKAYGDTEEPSTAIPSSDTEQPDKFDLDDEQDKELKAAAKNFINEFYEQDYLFQQGQIVKELLSVLLSIKSGEEKEKAARSKRTRDKIQEQEEDKLEASKGRLRSIQISFRTFLRDIKVAKKALKNFQEVADKGSIVASSTKKEFIKLLQRQQRDIVTLFNALTDAYTKRLDEAEASKGETELKWERIEKYYEIASENLRSLLNLSNDNELRNSILLIDETIDALRELTKEFPNVNPFGRKDDNYDQFGDEYDNAIEDVKSVSLQPILELTRTGSGSQSAVERALEGLKEFSQQIATIFGVKSQFKDAPPPPEKRDPAAEAGEEKPKITAGNKITTGKKPPEAATSEEFDIEDLYAVLVKHKDTYEKAKRLIETGSLNEDKRLANLKKVEDEFDTQADNLKSSFGVYGKSGPGYKDSVKKAAQTFVDLYDELTQAYNTLKDKELGTQASAKLTKVFSSIEGELDQMKKELEPARKDAPETTKKVKDKMYTLRLEVLKQLSPKKFGEALGLANYSKERLEQYRSVFLKFLLALKHFSKNNLEEAQADTVVSQLKTNLGEFSREAVQNSLNALSSFERDILRAIHGENNIGELYKAVKPLYNSEKFSSPINTTKAITPEFFSKGYVTLKGPKGKVDLSSITDTLADELKVGPEEAEEIATRIQKATVDLGQQSQDLPKEEFVDKIVDQVMQSDAVKKIVDNTEQEEVKDAVAKAVEQTVEEPEKIDKKQQELYAYYLSGSNAKTEDLSMDDIHNKINTNPNGRHMIYDENRPAGEYSGSWVEWKKHPDFKDYEPKSQTDAESDTPEQQTIENLESTEDNIAEAEMPQKLSDEILAIITTSEIGDTELEISIMINKMLSDYYNQASRLKADKDKMDEKFIDLLPDFIGDFSSLKSQIDDFTTQKQDADDKLNKAKKELEDLEPSKIRNRLNKLIDEIQKTERQIEEIDKSMKAADQQGKEEELEKLNQSYQKLQSSKEQLSEERKGIEQWSLPQIERLEGYIKEYEEKNKEISDTLQELQTQLNNKGEQYNFMGKLKKKLGISDKLEEQIANKLKPLIKEMLRRNK